MDITIAYFHSLHQPEVVKQDFEQIRATGAGSIVYAIHEQEAQRWPRDLERGLRQAQDAGLKVHLSLGRYGNLFAGPSLMPSWYTFHHLNTRIKDRHGRYHDISCYNHESFRSWLFKEIEQYLRNFPLNGILFDEPRGPDVTCFCSVCRALCPDVADLQRFRLRSMVDFLGELCACVKRVDANAKTTVVLLPQDLGQAEELAALPHLDTLGGHLFWQLLHEDVQVIERWGRGIVEVTRRHKKRSQLWLQNFNLSDGEELALESAFKQMVALEPDEVAGYYYWRNNENPDNVWQVTHGLLRSIPRRQLHWQMSATSHQMGGK
ncbi:MAG TPA: hypothetical protein VKP04_06465 [Ktedonobacteraceae bacterium]|nr:hypothetical protein [Ktedonobacteraceae bacterium]